MYMIYFTTLTHGGEVGQDHMHEIPYMLEKLKACKQMYKNKLKLMLA